MGVRGGGGRVSLSLGACAASNKPSSPPVTLVSAQLLPHRTPALLPTAVLAQRVTSQEGHVQGDHTPSTSKGSELPLPQKCF